MKKEQISEELKRFKLMTGYNPSLTLNENKDVISEQQTENTGLKKDSKLFNDSDIMGGQEYPLNVKNHEGKVIMKFTARTGVLGAADIFKTSPNAHGQGAKKTTFMTNKTMMLEHITSLYMIINSLKNGCYKRENSDQYVSAIFRFDELFKNETGYSFLEYIKRPNLITYSKSSLNFSLNAYYKQMIKNIDEQTNYDGCKMENQVQPSGTTTDQKSSDVTKQQPTGNTTNQQSSSYKPCPNFPFIKGKCKSEKIREIQNCIGEKSDGYYGPITEKRLKELGYDITNGITEEIYNKIMGSCKKETSSIGTPTSQNTPPVGGLKTRKSPSALSINQNIPAAIAPKSHQVNKSANRARLT